MTDTRDRAREQFWRHHDATRYQCPGCGRRRSETARMDVHHRDGNPRNNHPGNLIALCKRCHLGDQHDRDLSDTLGPRTPRGTAPRTPRAVGPGA